jgi:hypothetical protein
MHMVGAHLAAVEDEGEKPAQPGCDKSVDVFEEEV